MQVVCGKSVRRDTTFAICWKLLSQACCRRTHSITAQNVLTDRHSLLKVQQLPQLHLMTLKVQCTNVEECKCRYFRQLLRMFPCVWCGNALWNLQRTTVFPRTSERFWRRNILYIFHPSSIILHFPYLHFPSFHICTCFFGISCRHVSVRPSVFLSVTCRYCIR